MKGGTKIATRYAKSLLEIAIEQNKVDAILADMNFLLATNNDSRDFEMLVASPIISGAKKLEIFNKIFTHFDELTMKFISLVSDNSREAYLAQIAESFSVQVKEYKGIVPIELVSARPLDADTKAKIIAKIKAVTEGELEIDEKIDETLIGGFVVRMGDMQIDASVSNQFNKLKQRLAQ